MDFFRFNQKKSDIATLVPTSEKALQAIMEEKGDDKSKTVKKGKEKMSQNLSEMKFILYGDADNEPKAEEADKLANALLESELLVSFLTQSAYFDFQAKKDIVKIYNYLLRHKKDNAVSYIEKHPDILAVLVKGYDDSDNALNWGDILKNLLKTESFCKTVLSQSVLFHPFFDYVQNPNFDTASDAFLTFRMLLTKHKALSSKYLKTNFAEFFEKYNVLLKSDNFATKLQALRLLQEILFAEENFDVRMQYISDAENLKMTMNLLRVKYKLVQLETFHVFKLFVANPNKPDSIISILSRNKDTIIEFLTKLNADKDEQFNAEKEMLLIALADLPAPAAAAAAAPAAAPAAAAAPADKSTDEQKK